MRGLIFRFQQGPSRRWHYLAKSTKIWACKSCQDGSIGKSTYQGSTRTGIRSQHLCKSWTQQHWGGRDRMTLLVSKKKKGRQVSKMAHWVKVLAACKHGWVCLPEFMEEGEELWLPEVVVLWFHKHTVPGIAAPLPSLKQINKMEMKK